VRVAVFGAATQLGQEVITDLVFRGHEVIAYLPGPQHPRPELGAGVETVVGELTDAPAIGAAVAQGQAVINALDPRWGPAVPGLALVRVTAHIVGAMHRHGVSRYIGYACPTVTVCPHEQLTPRVWAHRLHARCFRARTQEQLAQLATAVRASGLDWTLVRFLHLRHGPARGLKHVGYFDPHTMGGPATLTDIARFSAAQVLDTAHFRAAPAVGG
jgi:putative NADH-flavin reductase